MQTIDLNDFKAYEPAMEMNDWVIAQEEVDIEVVDVVQLLIEGKLPAIQTIGFLLERGALTEQQMVCLMLTIEQHTHAEKDFDTIGRIVTMIPPEHLTRLDKARKDWRDERPRTPENQIHSYLLESAVVMSIRGEFTRIVDAVENHSPNTFTRVAEGLLGEVCAMSLKMAFYHWFRNNPPGKAKVLLHEFKQDIVRCQVRDTISSDDYEVSTDKAAELVG